MFTYLYRRFKNHPKVNQNEGNVMPVVICGDLMIFLVLLDLLTPLGYIGF